MENKTVLVRFAVLPHGKGLEPPRRWSENASGIDLMAAVQNDTVIEPGVTKVVPTGLIVEIPVGFEGQIRPRSGLAAKHSITLPNSPGTIDADYRGEIMVIMHNGGREPFVVKRGDRIAQLAICPVAVPAIEIAALEELTVTRRGARGLGSTGTHSTAKGE